MPIELPPVVAHDKQELRQLIKEAHLHGTGMSLNHIDVSRVDDFSYLFSNMHFTSDISEWDMYSARDLSAMFRHSQWRGDLSKWNVQGALVMDEMFRGSSFTGDLSRWQTGNVRSMARMFEQSIFTGDISKWNVCQVKNFHNMFDGSVFNGDLSAWDVRRAESMTEMFVRCDYSGDISAWRPEALVTADTVLTRHSMREMPTPCFFHWYSAIVNNRVFESDILEFVHRHKPTMDALGLDPVQASLAMQEHWLQTLATAEPALELPDLEF